MGEGSGQENQDFKNHEKFFVLQILKKIEYINLFRPSELNFFSLSKNSRHLRFHFMVYFLTPQN